MSKEKNIIEKSLTESDFDKVEAIREETKKNPVEIELYNGENVGVWKYVSGNDIYYDITLNNTSVTINEDTYAELSEFLKSNRNERELVLTLVMGMLIGSQGDLSYTDFCKKFGVIAGCYNQLPKMDKNDLELFNQIMNMQHKVMENVVDLINAEDIKKLPDFVKAILIEYAEMLHADITNESTSQNELKGDD